MSHFHSRTPAGKINYSHVRKKEPFNKKNFTIPFPA